MPCQKILQKWHGGKIFEESKNPQGFGPTLDIYCAGEENVLPPEP